MLTLDADLTSQRGELEGGQDTAQWQYSAVSPPQAKYTAGGENRKLCAVTSHSTLTLITNLSSPQPVTFLTLCGSRTSQLYSRQSQDKFNQAHRQFKNLSGVKGKTFVSNYTNTEILVLDCSPLIVVTVGL